MWMSEGEKAVYMLLMRYMQNMLEPTHVSIKINAVDILLPFTVGRQAIYQMQEEW